MARLIILSRDHGPHLFIVQIRSAKDGTQMPGIELGNLGLKMEYNTTCNGIVTFNHVRNPRTDMLIGHASVSKDGVHKWPSHPNLLFATILSVRTIISRLVTFQLAQAVTIATRYSVVREQSIGINELGSMETLIMAYKSQHFKLAAGLKEWSTQTAAEGAEDARKCCGGQGYLNVSGMPEIMAVVTATATLEGEDYVMWQQS
ncbi:acyl-CoA dehydrogenase/oxidase C-terminal [Zopfia rhizophila CBS 207.26]|uniref:Acyl-CoA dehydrogenase/oxidase C-terminal n=1 Tax=Zopfia rhizophila CBS 207.26 TaxID=1314779 RepID=A0A6A6EVM1_9PEZI|nr:acyl-CoA dehydrogenase/oxidase C-terminal [Zopfia rhizophila CBS 207.26]